MNDLPPVSCMCLTYGRPSVLEEAVESFLRQDYTGKKELLILNDFNEQTLKFDHPEVKIVNVPRRFHTVGEKRNACAALCAHDLLFVWDDDDIYLPHRISYSVKMLDESKGFFKPSKAWTYNFGMVEGPKSMLFHSGGCWFRWLFDKVRGYAHMGSGQDQEIEVKFEREHCGKGKNFNEIPLRDIYYLYRWGGTGFYHLSGFGRDKDGQPTGNEKVGEWVRRRVESREIPTGEIVLKPAWREDYCGIIQRKIVEIENAAVNVG